MKDPAQLVVSVGAGARRLGVQTARADVSSPPAPFLVVTGSCA